MTFFLVVGKRPDGYRIGNVHVSRRGAQIEADERQNAAVNRRACGAVGDRHEHYILQYVVEEVEVIEP
jgi:hypothetical protein